ncbi:MAG: RluA family pseudouridine synthase [Planctomycetota bacterium]
MAERFVAAEAGGLFAQLAAHFPTWRRNTLRERLKQGCVAVNGDPVRRADHGLLAGDVVTVADAGDAPARSVRGALVILHADDDLVAIDKPVGLLSVASDDERERTAMAMLGQQLAPGRGVPLWPAHRLDRETSGVLLFARSRAVCDLVQANWGAAEKSYVAIVAGRPDPPIGVIEAPLWEDGNLRVRVGEHATAKAARTRYRTLATGPDRAHLAVELDTGRKHQIRAHLAWLGHPVVGDDRYGSKDQRLFLHAHRLTLLHPRGTGPLMVEAPVPREFDRALGGRR